MSSPTPCPAAAAIRRFLEGARVGVEADGVAEHLIGCSDCREAAIAMSSHPAVVEAIRAWSSLPRGQAAVTAPSSSTDETRAVTDSAPSEPRSAVNPGSSGERSGPGWSGGRTSSSSSGFRSDSARTQVDDQNVLEPPLEPDEIGRLGPYRVLELLGEGGMGLVYRAIDTQLGRAVALKVMRPSVAQSAAARGRFEREARAIAALEHDHIISIFQVGESNGLPYLAMPLLQGETLDRRLRSLQKLPIAEALRIARQVAEGLEAAHLRGLVHRDIKPGNVWIETSRNRIKILDFGLAREAGADDELTQTGIIIGTPAYMAPEQAANEPIDARTDLFSLGSLLYRMVTGSAPFQGTNSLSILRALAVGKPKPPRDLNPDIPVALSKYILRMLEKDPALRPQSASEVVKELTILEREVSSLAGATVPGSLAMSAIQRALLDDIGLADEGSDVHPPQPGRSTVTATPAGAGKSTITGSPSGSGTPPGGPAGSSGVRTPPTVPGASAVRSAPSAGSRPPAAASSSPGGSQVVRGTPADRAARPPATSGVRPAPSTGQPAPPARSPRASGVGPVPAPGEATGSAESRTTRATSPAPERLMRGIDTSFLDEISTAPAPLMAESRRRRPRRPIPWPLVISLALVLFMATLALLIVMNRRG